MDPAREIDPGTGTELSPGHPAECNGNGKHTDADGQPLPLCCDECDFFLKCFPESEPQAPVNH